MSPKPTFSLPPGKRAGVCTPDESKHHVGCREILARRRIEQHAHIPYTHGFHSLQHYDEFTTAIQQILGAILGMHTASVERLTDCAAFNPQMLIPAR